MYKNQGLGYKCYTSTYTLKSQQWGQPGEWNAYKSPSLKIQNFIFLCSIKLKHAFCIKLQFFSYQIT